MVVTTRRAVWARERDPMAYGFLKVGALTLSLAGMGTLAVTGAAGCGSDNNSGVANAKLPNGVRSQVIEHEACDESGNKVEMLDANNDGKPDIKKVSKNGHEICRITDLNHDGKPDMFEYFDATGQLRRREADYDDNGIVNSIEYFENGKLVRRELDTTNQGKIDTWTSSTPRRARARSVSATRRGTGRSTSGGPTTATR